LTVPALRRPSNRGYADIRIRAAHGWTHRHGEEAPHVGLSASEKAELGRLAQIIDFRTAGSLIFSQGDEAGFVYLLTVGLVRICHSLRNGERQVVAFHWPGDLFGLAEQAKYVNSAETILPTRVYRFQAARLERFLLKNPKIQDGFLIKATHDLRHAQRQIIVMGRFDIPRRLAVFLIDCSVHESYFDQSTHVLTVPMSRYDIADYLGTSAETVTRAFTRLERAGLLRRVTARTIELKPESLKAFINFE
jgi:CRP-like cAMP-binding protein